MQPGDLQGLLFANSFAPIKFPPQSRALAPVCGGIGIRGLHPTSYPNLADQARVSTSLEMASGSFCYHGVCGGPLGTLFTSFSGPVPWPDDLPSGFNQADPFLWAG